MSEIGFDKVGMTFNMSENGGLRVLDDISFTVEKGEFVSILGPSGSGKSTILNLIMGSLEPTNGSVIAPELADVASVFQTARLLPWMTLRENIDLTRKERYKKTKMKYSNSSDHYIDLVGLDAFGDFYPAAMSGGMRQRGSLGRALSVEPSVLLMDEPFSALDALTAIEQRSFLKQTWEQHKKTILFITHNVREAIELSTKIIVISKSPAKVLMVEEVTPEEKEIGNPAAAKLENRILELLGVL